MKVFLWVFGTLSSMLLIQGYVQCVALPRKPEPFRRETSAFTQPLVTSVNLEARVLTTRNTNMNLQYFVLAPPGYSNGTISGKKYPVMYWLHGSAGGDRSRLPLAKYFTQAMKRGTIPEMFVIFPESLPQSMWTNSKNGVYLIEDVLTKELIPHVATLYPLSSKIKDNTIAGFSMGGYGAARIGLKYPSIFGRIVMIGSGTLDTSLDYTPRASSESRDRILNTVYGGDRNYFYAQSPRYIAKANLLKIKQKQPIITIIVGDQDEVFDQNVRFSEYLTKLGLENRLVELPGISHNLKSYISAIGESIGDLFLATPHRNH